MKNLSDSIGNPTRDLPACSAVAQPTAPLRTSNIAEEPSLNRFTSEVQDGNFRFSG
jgi:hypothetical protein